MARIATVIGAAAQHCASGWSVQRHSETTATIIAKSPGFAKYPVKPMSWKAGCITSTIPVADYTLWLTSCPNTRSVMSNTSTSKSIQEKMTIKLLVVVTALALLIFNLNQLAAQVAVQM